MLSFLMGLVLFCCFVALLFCCCASFLGLVLRQATLWWAPTRYWAYLSALILSPALLPYVSQLVQSSIDERGRNHFVFLVVRKSLEGREKLLYLEPNLLIFFCCWALIKVIVIQSHHFFFALSLLPPLHRRPCQPPRMGGPRRRPALDISAGLPWSGLGGLAHGGWPLLFSGVAPHPREVIDLIFYI